MVSYENEGGIRMDIKIVGKDIKATDAIKAYAEKKVERINKYFDGDFEVVVTIKTEKNEQIAEMHVTAKGEVYRAVTSHTDLYASIDKDIDILEGQIRKWKTKKDKLNKSESIKQKNSGMAEFEHHKIENEIIKTIYYDIKPMTPEDAKLKLQESYDDKFLVFINIETNKANVIYRLKDNVNYGLLEPEV